MKKIIAIVGKSGSGKTKLIQMLNNEFKLTPCINYTSRKPRIGDNDYIFTTKEKIIEKRLNNELFEIVNYNGNLYGIPIQEQDVIIIAVDPIGLAQLIKYCKLNNIELMSIYLSINEQTQKERLKKRGDDEKSIENRIKNDIYFDEFKKLYNCIIDANNQSVEQIFIKIKGILYFFV